MQQLNTLQLQYSYFSLRGSYLIGKRDHEKESESKNTQQATAIIIQRSSIPVFADCIIPNQLPAFPRSRS